MISVLDWVPLSPTDGVLCFLANETVLGADFVVLTEILEVALRAGPFFRGDLSGGEGEEEREEELHLYHLNTLQIQDLVIHYSFDINVCTGVLGVKIQQNVKLDDYY